MPDENWDGVERRKEQMEISIQLAEIKKDIGYIKTGVDSFKTTFKEHLE